MSASHSHATHHARPPRRSPDYSAPATESGSETGSEPRSGEAAPSRRDFLRRAGAGLLAGTVALEQVDAAAGAVETGVRAGSSPHGGAQNASFSSGWPAGVRRHWAGPDFWTNPLQDWRIAEGRLEMIGGGGDRNVQLLTRDLPADPGPFDLSVRLGADSPRPGASAGFELGIIGELPDYRHRAIHGSGLRAGITAEGEIFIGSRAHSQIQQQIDPSDGLILELSGRPSGGEVRLTLRARAPGGSQLAQTSTTVSGERPAGNLALFGDVPDGDELDRGAVRLWFSNWTVEGDGVAAHPDRSFGPVLWTQYTLDRGVLKMQAQMPPLGSEEERTARLQLREGGSWTTVSERPIDPTARTASFRVEGWEASSDRDYRIAYRLTGAGGETETHYYEGTVRRDPVEKPELVVAGLSCQTDPGFPHGRIADGLAHHDPDLLAFMGDQFYESSGGYGVVRDPTAPIELSALDYLRKWYLHGWAFGDLMRDRPTICMPDDHDVYHGNIWGEGGKDATADYELHNDGGYHMPARWVNLVQRTQTGHLPDPYDPRPVRQGISVYYTDMNYGRVSFAIVEDRKWKSGPDGLVPPIPGRPDHVTDPEFDVSSLDVESAELLGQRQLSFLEDWGSDWQHADAKVVVSQTPFAQVPTHHGGNYMYLVSDLDSNSWPQTPRNEALRRIRKAHAYHLCGDQHLPMVLHYGVDDWEDAGGAFAVPAICTGYPRWFHPKESLENSPSGAPSNIGRYVDGLGNEVTIRAVANPVETPFPDDLLERLAGKSSGYGILRIDKQAGTYTAEAWPLLSDPADPETQFDRWPQTTSMAENYGRTPAAHLPRIEVEGISNPAIQIIDDETGEVIYTLRVRGTSFRPPVFSEGLYAIRVGDDAEWVHTEEKVETVPEDSDATITVGG